MSLVDQAQNDRGGVPNLSLVNATREKNMPLNDYSYHFTRFWNEYPIKVGKGAAWKSWQKLVKGEDEAKFADELVLHLTERKKKDAKWIEGKYVPQPATFLNQSRWEDEYKRVSDRNGSRGWAGHIATDEENKLMFVETLLRRNQPIPPEYRQYEERVRRGLEH